MGALNKQPSASGEEEKLARELDAILEKVIGTLKDILKHPYQTDEVTTMEKFSRDLIELDAISQKAADLEC